VNIILSECCNIINNKMYSSGRTTYFSHEKHKLHVNKIKDHRSRNTLYIIFSANIANSVTLQT